MITSDHIKYTVLILLLILISSIFYSVGYYNGVKTSVKLGVEFVDIDLDEEMLTTAIYQYNNRVSGCLFNENASRYYNPGN